MRTRSDAVLLATGLGARERQTALMSTIFLGERPPAIDDWLVERQRLGQDRYDELWEGSYHVVPGPPMDHAGVDADLMSVLGARARAGGLLPTTAFTLGGPQDYRVPDGGLYRARSSAVYVETAAAVVEVLSPGDETCVKFAFYAAHGVEEIVVADPSTRTVRVWQLRDGDDPSYEETGRSGLLDVTAAELTDAIDWP